MSTGPIDVAGLIERRRFDGFNIRLIVISALITLFDGFDLSIAAFTAPYFKGELGLSTSQLANVFSVGLLGMTIGAVVMPYWSDRIGRRPLILATALAFGLLTTATAFVQSYEAFVALRLLDGFAIGGMVPICWALNTEYAPKRLRATVITVVMIGYSVGTSGAGPLTVLLEPVMGWRGLYLFGGIGAIVVTGSLALWLPESVRFLVSNGRRPDVVARLVNTLDRSATATASDRFILGDETDQPQSARMRELFAGPLAVITPLLWLCFAASSLAIYFVNGWGPILLEAMKFDRSTAALATALGGVCGSVAGLAIMRFTDRRGPLAVLVYPVPLLGVLLAVGAFDFAPTTVLVLAMTSLALIGGMHFAIMSIIGDLYPTRVRGSGAGWTSSVGKLAGVFGPLLGGVLMNSGLPVTRSFLFLMVCPLVVIAAASGIVVYTRRRSGAEAAPKVRTTR